jgi:hypothetical protein
MMFRAGVGNPHLCIELDEGRPQAHKACEQGLVQVAILLKGHVLHDRRQLVMVANQNHPLQPAVPIFLPLRVSKHRTGVSDAVILRVTITPSKPGTGRKYSKFLLQNTILILLE